MSKLLAMMKPKNYMYATIKGSLTENPSGVFSGFAYNNYLATQQIFDTSKDFEIIVKMNSGTMDAIYTPIISNSFGENPLPFGFTFGLVGTNTNKKIRSYIKDSEDNYISNGIYGITVIPQNEDFFLKFSQNGNTIKIEYSTNGKDWITQNTWISTNKIKTAQGISFGGGNYSDTTRFWKGSIDFNQSYIKITNTKYRLQAVVGYTKVGNPTITDGVVSGFSNSNYLEIKKYLNSDNLEMVIDFTTGNSFNANETVFLNRSICNLEYHSNGLYSYNWQQSSFVNVIPSSDYITNTHYKVKIKRNGNTISFAYSKNGSAYVDTGSFTTNKTATNFVCFGNSSVNTDRYFNGSIDLNETYIKQNNKLWFNGQPAE